MPFPESVFPVDELAPSYIDQDVFPEIVRVREYPPTDLTVDVTTQNGKHFRWADDELDPSNVPLDLVYSKTMPGGDEQFSCKLTRKTELDYPDLAEFSEVVVYDVGGTARWGGRIETMPRNAGGDDLAVLPGAVGHQAELTDNASIKALFVDIDQTHWKDGTARRKFVLGSTMDLDGPSTLDDPTATPVVMTKITGAWSRAHACEAWYDAQGLNISSVYFAWYQSGNVSGVGWAWYVALCTDDIGTVSNQSANQLSAGPFSVTLNATGLRSWAAAAMNFGSAGGSEGVDYAVYWFLAVYGDHGLPRYGTATSTSAQGLLASDIIQYSVNEWTNLKTVKGGMPTIEPTTFIVPHLTFFDATDVGNIVSQANRFEMNDWWVDSTKVFHLAAPGNHGKKWQARVGSSNLQSTGPQVDRIYNKVVVTFRDKGVTRTVGPTGTAVDSISDELIDSDPQNPATLNGYNRVKILPDIGVSTLAGAIQIGKAWMNQQKIQSTAGQAELTGFVEDDHGVIYPASNVEAGDQISFTDASDTSYRNIIKSGYSNSSKKNQIELDSPSDALKETLERMQFDQIQVSR